ncbi:MAG: alpha-L-fucosidase [Nocardioidaceae bacterium]|nr:alpha-L-fucosidase [Nocardioidaceae bacterium]
MRQQNARGRARRWIAIALGAVLTSSVMTATASPSDADQGTTLLLVRFNGQDSGTGYQTADDEVVDGSMSITGGTIRNGVLSLPGDTSRAVFRPAADLIGAQGVTQDVVVEARLRRTATADSLDTMLGFFGNGSYRFRDGRTGEATLWSDGHDEAKTSAAPAVGWRFRHIALVYDYRADGSSTLTAYADGCPVGTAEVGGALTPAVDAIGFGGDVHPAAGRRGLAADIDSIAVSTYTGRFSPDSFRLPNRYSAPARDLPAHVVPVSPCDSASQLQTKAGNVVPTKRQLDWQRQELTAFVHFGVNTFTDSEWGTGMEDPAVFDPSDLDADQWARTLKNAGFKTLILTVKHHDGFVLYPSRYTDHSVRSSPWRTGRGDVLREVVEAAKRQGIGVGVYLSPADLHEIHAPGGRYGNGSPTRPSTIPTLVDGDDRSEKVASGALPTFRYDVDDYNRYFLNQLYELLTQYGPINEFWFDGANPEPGVDETYDEQAWFDLIRKVQPDATIAVGGPDVRWVGNESGSARESEWSVLPFGGEPGPTGGEMLADATSKAVSSEDLMRQADFLRWYPAEVDVSIRPGWFYHASQDASVKSLPRLLSIYQQSVGRNSVLLLNVPPDRRGLINETDAARLAEFGNAIRDAYDDDLAAGATVRSDVASPATHPAGAVADGDPTSYWTPASARTATLELQLARPSTFNTVSLQEAVEVGQRISSVAVDAWTDGEWVEVASGTTVGYKRLLPTYEQVSTDRLRVRILDSRGAPTLTTVGLYDDPNRPQPQTFDSFAEAMTNVGITNDNDTARGDIDGSGSSFSAQALAAVGIVPGGTTTHDGITFTWANVSPGAPDHVVAGGQTIKMTASGSKLGFVTTGTYGASHGTVMIRYADGTVQRDDLATADWLASAAPSGSDILATTAYRNRPNGQDTNAAKLFFTAIPIDPAKTVASVTLPNISAEALEGTPAMHVFAIAAD